METHKNLMVWQKSISFVTAIYELTKTFPKEEIYCIVNQLRRAAISIPSNIAEGSAAELETQLIISMNLGYIDNKKSLSLQNDLEEVFKMLSGLIRSLKSR